MFPPLTKGPPVGRIMLEVVKLVFFAELRDRCERFGHEPGGFVLKAAIERNKELKAQGKEWGDPELEDFLHVRLPQALEDAEQHAQARAAVETPPREETWTP